MLEHFKKGELIPPYRSWCPGQSRRSRRCSCGGEGPHQGPNKQTCPRQISWKRQNVLEKNNLIGKGMKKLF